jgi:hypothetical protein
MKKAKLQIEPAFDFELLGIVSPIREYRMAWLVNQELELNLIKADDLELEFLNAEKLEIAQYLLSLPHGFIQLLKNKAINSTQQAAYLIPELKNLDYFLLIQDETEELDLINFVKKLSRNPLVQSIVRIDITKLKSKENLLTY